MNQPQTRRLLLLRHAKSAWDSGAPSDFERPLATRGCKDAPRMARWLLEHALIPDLIVCSSAARTRQTLQLMLPILGLNDDCVAMDDRLYAASAHRIHKIVRETADDCETLMVVAHNPGLDHLLEDLCGPGLERTAKGKLMTTACLADLQFSDYWQNIPDGNCKLMSLVRPRTLPNQP